MYDMPSEKYVFPIAPWLRIFAMISMQRFGEIYEDLDFPLPLTRDLQSIARGFVEAYFRLMKSEVIIPYDYVNFFERISVGPTLIERQKILFELVFSELEVSGRAEPIYRWGLNSQFFMTPNQSNIKRKYMCLLHWAHHNYVFIPDGNYTGELKEFIEISQVARNPTLYPISSIPLAQQIQLALYALVLRNTLIYESIKKIPSALRENSHDAWENLVTYNALAGGVVVSNEAFWRLSSRTWREIYSQFNRSEIEIIEKWVQDYMPISQI